MLLDSANVFRQLDLGRLEGSEMVLSYDYSSRLVPLLSLDAGRYRTDSSETVKSILRQAEGLKLQAAYVVDTARRTTALLLTPSTAALSEALLHIEAGSSILDADGFPEALSRVKGGEGSIILRNAAAGYIIPRGFLGQLPHRALSRFCKRACQWTVLSFDSCRTSSIGVDFYLPDDDSRYLSIFEGLKGGESCLGQILPTGAELAIDLPLGDWEAFYKARRRWLDAGSMLQHHEAACKDAEQKAGMRLLDWCRRARPREVAVFGWEGHRLVALRCRRVPALPAPAPASSVTPGPDSSVTPGSDRVSPCTAFIPLLFGGIYAEPEGAVHKVKGRWLLVGSEEDIAAFSETEPSGLKPEKHVKYSISAPGLQLVCTDRGAQLSYGK